MIILPRQARDKHRKNSKKRRVLAGNGRDRNSRGCSGAAACNVFRWNQTRVRKTPLFEAFIPMMIVLPRQARDRHRKKLRKGGDHSAGNQKGACHSGPHVPNATGNATCATVMYLLRGIFNLVELPVRFNMGGRPVLSAHFNVETARSEHNRPEI